VASVGDDIVSGLEAVVNGSVEALATILATFTTVRQAIRTIAAAVAQAAMQGQVNTVLAKYQAVPLSPAVLADMSIRNLTIPSDASGLDVGLVTEASYSGIDPGRFAAMSLDTGESYGIDQALSLWWNYQNLITPVAAGTTDAGTVTYTSGAILADTYGIPEAELDTVIHYSRVRDQFIPDLKQLPWSTMSKADAIDTLVKGRADHDLAKAMFVAAGGIPEQFDLLYSASGDSVGVVTAVELYSHQMITEDQLNAVIAQSRINPEFDSIAKLTNAKWLPPYQLEKVIAAGLVDAPTATTWLIELGYPEDQASVFVASAMAGTVKSVKSESEAMILADYEAQILDEDDATTALESLGYQSSAIPVILDSVIARRVLTMRNAAVNRLRTAFIDYLVTTDQVRTDLGSLGIPTAAQDQFLAAWSIEQQTNVKRLSAAQVGKLTEDGVIDQANAVARWTQMGYLPEEAELLLYIYPPPAPTTPPTTPPVLTVPPSNVNPEAAGAAGTGYGQGTVNSEGGANA
jgi:hypothetical protein